MPDSEKNPAFAVFNGAYPGQPFCTSSRTSSIVMSDMMATCSGESPAERARSAVAFFSSVLPSASPLALPSASPLALPSTSPLALPSTSPLALPSASPLALPSASPFCSLSYSNDFSVRTVSQNLSYALSSFSVNADTSTSSSALFISGFSRSSAGTSLVLPVISVRKRSHSTAIRFSGMECGVNFGSSMNVKCSPFIILSLWRSCTVL